MVNRMGGGRRKGSSRARGGVAGVGLQRRRAAQVPAAGSGHAFVWVSGGRLREAPRGSMRAAWRQAPGGWKKRGLTPLSRKKRTRHEGGLQVSLCSAPYRGGATRAQSIALSPLPWQPTPGCWPRPGCAGARGRPAHAFARERWRKAQEGSQGFTRMVCYPLL